jgi:acyl transferase domain-containing protein
MAPGNGAHALPADLGIDVAQQASRRRIDYALSNSFAFGGSNATVVLANEPGRARLGGKRAARHVEWFAVTQLCSADSDEPEAPNLLPVRALGRASPLTRTFARLLSRLAARGVDVARVPLVFASAFGEMQTTLELLLQSEKGESSPLRFQSSVHNAAQGVLSIATGHKGFATSMSAGADTFAMALVEAAGVVASGQDEVVVLVAEEAPLPELSAASYPPLGVGLHLKPGAEPVGPRITPPFRAPVDATDLSGQVAEAAHNDSPVSDILRLWAAHVAGVPTRVPLGANPLSGHSESRWVLEYLP